MVSSLFAIFFGALLFVALLAIGSFSSINILFYRGLLVAFVTVVAQWFVLRLFTRTRSQQHDREIASYWRLAVCSVTLAGIISFLVTVPVTIDRSVTVFLLGTLADSPAPITKEALRYTLIQRYVNDFDAVERRMREQIRSGNVTERDGAFVLTMQGRAFIEASRRLASLLQIDRKFLDPGQAIPAANENSRIIDHSNISTESAPLPPPLEGQP